MAGTSPVLLARLLLLEEAGGGGGGIQYVLYGEAPPGGSNPYPLIY